MAIHAELRAPDLMAFYAVIAIQGGDVEWMGVDRSLYFVWFLQ